MTQVGMFLQLNQQLKLHTKALISLKCGKIGPRLLLGPVGSLICTFDWCQNQRPWMTLKVHYSIFDMGTKACLAIHP